MDDLIKLVRSYRLAAGLSERLRLAEQVFHLIVPDLRVFVFGSVSRQVGEDALQEVLKAVATSLKNFRGNTEKEFWAWCYRIARHKLYDQYRKQYADRTVPMPQDELREILELSGQDAPITAQTKMDLEYVMQLLQMAKPECSDLLWRHYVIGLDYTELAEETDLKYDAVRMKIGRCLDEAKALVS